LDNVGDFLKDAPSNWGRWGPEDEVGTLNFLDNTQVLRGITSVKTGELFTLGQLIRNSYGDLVGGTRRPAGYNTLNYPIDNSGGVEFSDDMFYMFTHGSSHVDALGHIWYDGKLYNGYDAETAVTAGGLTRNSVHHVGNRGVVGRAVLLDVARFKGVEWLPAGMEITFDDLMKTAAYQNVTLEKRDIIIIRTGFYLYYLRDKRNHDHGNEPGITYTEDITRWFYEQEIPVYGTDTLGSEQTRSSQTGSTFPLHPYFITRLGISILENLWLEELADACAADGRYDFCMTISAMKLIGGAGSPINPIAIR
jgi:kynurenine formamidase